jgi:hypothetical protein
VFIPLVAYSELVSAAEICPYSPLCRPAGVETAGRAREGGNLPFILNEGMLFYHSSSSSSVAIKEKNFHLLAGFYGGVDLGFIALFVLSLLLSRWLHPLISFCVCIYFFDYLASSGKGIVEVICLSGWLSHFFNRPGPFSRPTYPLHPHLYMNGFLPLTFVPCFGGWKEVLGPRSNGNLNPQFHQQSMMGFRRGWVDEATATKV